MTTKAAGVTVYLMEELTDARLRCDQLKRYVDQAMRLVSQSAQKDHIYGVAGNLMYGIPDTLLRLDKALDATALAASRLDYEELKQELRPEKVQELEEVMKDVRIRHFDRRAPKVPEGMVMKKLATGGDVVAALRNLAAAIENEERQGIAPSRSKIVRTLNHMAASVGASDEKLSEEALRARFEEGKPADPTENMSPEDAKKWREMTEEHKDEFKTASDAELKAALTRLSVAKKAVAAVSVGEAQRLADSAKKLEKELHDLFTANYKTNYYAEVDPSFVSRLQEAHEKTLRNLKALSKISSKGADPILTKDLSTFGYMGLQPTTFSEAAGLGYVIVNKALLVLWKAKRAEQQVRFYTNWVEQYESTGQSPSLNDQWKWLREASAQEFDVTDVLPGYEGDEAIFTATSVKQATETLMSRFEEGKPADPTENMSPEDAKKWEEMNEEHGDKFKSASGDLPSNITALTRNLAGEVKDMMEVDNQFLLYVGTHNLLTTVELIFKRLSSSLHNADLHDCQMLQNRINDKLNDLVVLSEEGGGQLESAMRFKPYLRPLPAVAKTLLREHSTTGYVTALKDLLALVFTLFKKLGANDLAMMQVKVVGKLESISGSGPNDQAIYWGGPDDTGIDFGDDQWYDNTKTAGADMPETVSVSLPSYMKTSAKLILSHTKNLSGAATQVDLYTGLHSILKGAEMLLKRQHSNLYPIQGRVTTALEALCEELRGLDVGGSGAPLPGTDMYLRSMLQVAKGLAGSEDTTSYMDAFATYLFFVGKVFKVNKEPKLHILQSKVVDGIREELGAQEPA